MIYCVVPKPLADELYPKLVEHYEDDDNVTRDRRPARVRPPRPPRAARSPPSDCAQRRVVRDRRRARVAGDMLPLAARLSAPRDARAPCAAAHAAAMKLIVHVDGGARGNPGPAAAAGVICSPDGERPRRARRSCSGTATNNVAEYRALLLGLDARAELGATEVEVVGDSELIAKQVQGVYKVKHRRHAPAAPRGDGARCGGFERWSIRTVPRAQNARADALVNAALDAQRRRGSAARAARSVEALGRFGDREHLRVREFLEQRVRDPVEHVALRASRSTWMCAPSSTSR